MWHEDSFPHVMQLPGEDSASFYARETQQEQSRDITTGSILARVWYNRTSYPLTSGPVQITGIDAQKMMASSLEGYQPGDQLTHTFSLWAQWKHAYNPINLLAMVYGWLNSDVRPNGGLERSLAVGDVVELVGEHFDDFYAYRNGKNPERVEVALA